MRKIPWLREAKEEERESLSRLKLSLKEAEEKKRVLKTLASALAKDR